MASLEGYAVRGSKLFKGLKSWELAGVTATVDLGAPNKRITATRLVALGVFALAAKKNTGKVFVSVFFPDGEQLLIESSVKNEKDARAFVAQVNTVGARTS